MWKRKTENYATAPAGSPLSAFRFPFSVLSSQFSAYFTTSFLYAVPPLVAMRTM